MNELRNGLRIYNGGIAASDAESSREKFEEAMTAVYPRSQVCGEVFRRRAY
jgi:hypothetical protein